MHGTSFALSLPVSGVGPGTGVIQMGFEARFENWVNSIVLLGTFAAAVLGGIGLLSNTEQARGGLLREPASQAWVFK